MSQPGQVVVGQLYLGEYRNGLKVWDQPGGVGTRVYPQPPRVQPWFGGQNQENIERDGIYSWPLSFPSQYVGGCGHFLNCWEIYSYYDPYAEEVMALVTCPQCSYVQQILTLEQYQSYLDTPLVVA
jgi:hypothetical protein